MDTNSRLERNEKRNGVMPKTTCALFFILIVANTFAQHIPLRGFDKFDDSVWLSVYHENNVKMVSVYNHGLKVNGDKTKKLAGRIHVDSIAIQIEPLVLNQSQKRRMFYGLLYCRP